MGSTCLSNLRNVERDVAHCLNAGIRNDVFDPARNTKSEHPLSQCFYLTSLAISVMNGDHQKDFTKSEKLERKPGQHNVCPTHDGRLKVRPFFPKYILYQLCRRQQPGDRSIF